MRQLMRYATVGAAATLVHYLLLIACVELAHWKAWIASGYGAAMGAQVAYLGNRWFTFAHRGSLPVSWLRFQILWYFDKVLQNHWLYYYFQWCSKRVIYHHLRYC